MSTETVTLVDFLLARTAEDEAAARAVLGEHEMHDWDSYMSSAGWYDSPAHVFAQRNDPARVLAECEAKRRIVEEHPEGDDGYCFSEDAVHGCKWLWPCPTLRLLALPYADHPDYRQEFRP